MHIGTVCNRDVVVVNRDTSVTDVARLMRERHVGDVIVVEAREGHRRPVGIVTDRDLVVELMAEGIDTRLVNVGDLAGPDLVTVEETTSIVATIKYMRDRGIRRIPVINQSGSLTGIFTLDDALELLADQMQDIAGLIEGGIRREERHRRPAPDSA